MNKFKGFVIGITLILNSFIFGAVTANGTSQISLEAIAIPSITVADVDFGDYVLGDTKPSSMNAAITISSGAAGRTVNLSTSNISLSDGSGNSVGATLSISPEQVVLNGTGAGSSTMTVTLDSSPTVIGQYTGTATVTVQYN